MSASCVGSTVFLIRSGSMSINTKEGTNPQFLVIMWGVVKLENICCLSFQEGV